MCKDVLFWGTNTGGLRIPQQVKSHCQKEPLPEKPGMGDLGKPDQQPGPLCSEPAGPTEAFLANSLIFT